MEKWNVLKKGGTSEKKFPVTKIERMVITFSSLFVNLNVNGAPICLDVNEESFSMSRDFA